MSETSILTIHKPTDDQLPQGWQQIALGEIVSLKSGFAYKSRDWQETGVPVIKIANVRAGKVTIEGCSHIDKSIAAETVEFAVKESDILMTLTGEIGAIGVYRESFESRLNQRVARIDLHDTERTLLKYLIGFLESPEFRSEMWRLSKGMAQPNISPKQVVAIGMSLPPLAEQERIVEILEEQLSRLDAALESVRVVREKAAQFRRSLLHAAFTGTLTGHNPTDGQLPEGWAQQPLTEVLTDIQTGFASGKHNSLGVGVVHVRPMNISRTGDLEFHEQKFVQDTSSRRLARGDVLFNNTNSPALVGKTAFIDTDEDLAFSNHMTRLRVEPSALLPNFLAAQLHGKWMNGYFEAICSNHVNQASVSAKRLQTVEIAVPPLAEQEQIVEILEEQLSRLDAALAVADAIEKRSAALRRSLLHAAFTGRLTEKWRESAHV
jgi:restriction endonuclease S subunit